MLKANTDTGEGELLTSLQDGQAFLLFDKTEIMVTLHPRNGRGRCSVRKEETSHVYLESNDQKRSLYFTI